VSKGAGGPCFAPRLLVMVKEPVLGRVKTRLAREVGTVAATRFFRTNLTVTLQRIAHDRRWQTILAVAPDRAATSAMFPADLPCMRQGSGDLGTRMARMAKQAPPGPIVIVGGDIPGIRVHDIASAFASLRGADAVFGPAGDGGYWLVGLSHRARHIGVFNNVRWSSAFALSDTRANLAGFKVAEVALKHDVDDGADLAGLIDISGRLIC
jgi:uncharacterized protein